MAVRILTGLIRFYQLTISKVSYPACRFYPSCSEYMVQALERYGVRKGCYMGICRILKCQPFHPGGVDMVGECYESH